MKTISRSKNNRGRNRAIILGVALTLGASLLIFTGLFSKTFYGTMVALSGGSQGVGQAASSFASVFKSKASLESENAELQKLIDEKDALLSDRDFLLKENANLKANTHFMEDTGRTRARVLSKPPFTPFDVVVVAVGESDGIKEGDRVMLGEIYLGSIEYVDKDSSRIKLLSSPDADIESYIGDDAVPASLSGKGGGNFKTSLPQGSNVKEGDIVVSYHGNTPFMVGKVSKVIDNDDNTFMTILLTLPFNLYSLSYVEIISS